MHFCQTEKADPMYYRLVVSDECCGKVAIRKIVTTAGHTIWLCADCFEDWNAGKWNDENDPDQDTVEEVW